jgi:hypothetical protein
MCLTFKEPLFQVRLLQENLPTWLIGLLFSFDTISYTLTSFALNVVPESKKNYCKLVSIGVIIYFVAMTLSGPMPLILPDSLYIIMGGVFLQGSGGAFVNNNCVPALT